jgi:hypothetical protein
MPDTPVNSQITDAVTQANVKVVADAPAQSMAALYTTMSHSLGLAMLNAQNIQHGMQQISQAIVSAACAKIIALEPSSSPGSTPKT